MNRLKIFFGISLLSLSLLSCGRFSLYDSDKGAVVVTVGKSTLYEDDLINIYTAQVTSEDSAAQRKMYIDMWVKNQVKQQQAEADMTQTMPEIDKMVATYRNTLIAHQYEEQFVGGRLDTVVTKEQMELYYKENIDDFRLAGPLVKARIARIPSGLRQSDKLAKMFYSKKESDVADFINICAKNDYKIVDYTKDWVEFSQVLHHIPFSNSDFDAFLKSKSAYEVEDDQYKYLLAVESYLLTGSNAPLESQVRNIRKILLHNRRADLIKSLDDSLFNVAMINNVIEFY